MPNAASNNNAYSIVTGRLQKIEHDVLKSQQQVTV